MVIDATDKFLDRYATTILEATKKDGPLRAALRMAHLPISIRQDIRSRVVQLKTERR